MPTVEPYTISFPIEPLDGMFGLKPPSKIPFGGSPDMLNCYVRGETLRKRPGYTPLGPAVHATERVMGLFSAWDEDDNVFLFATHQTGLKRYDSGTDTWTTYTGPALTGGTEKKFSWEISQNAVVFSQGVDQVMRVPFTGTTYAILNANCPAAKFLTRFADRLYLAFTTESGAAKPFRIRRSVFGDHTNWTGLGSGFNDLSEYPYHMKGLRKHGAQVLVATELVLWVGTRTGLSGAPARFDPVVPGVGVYMPYTLTTKQNDQLFGGRDHMYAFSGNRVVEIMETVRDSIFFALEASKVHLNHAVLRPESTEWVVFICETGSATPNVAWVWNWGYNISYKWSFPAGHMTSEIHRQQSTRTWNNLTGSWSAQTWEWVQSESSTNFPVLVTGHANGKAYQWKEEVAGDDGSGITCRWTSKDFTASILLQQASVDYQITLKRLVIEYQASGTPCTLQFYLSTNGGDSWSGPFPVVLDKSPLTTGGFYTATLGEQITGDRIRWKFEHVSSTERFRISRFIPTFEIVGMPMLHATP